MESKRKEELPFYARSPRRSPRSRRCGGILLQRSDTRRGRNELLFHLVSFEEEAAARDQGCPPVFLCAQPNTHAAVCLCVFGTRGEERERDTRVKQIGRGAHKTAAFGHVLETQAFRLQDLHTGKYTKKRKNLLCDTSAVLSSHSAFGLISELIFGVSKQDAPRDFDAHVSLPDMGACEATER